MVDGERRIISDPPLIVPIEELVRRRQTSTQTTRRLGAAAPRVPPHPQCDRRHLLEQFQLVRVARKVVGVGSVGTRAWILLLEAATAATRCSCRPRRPRPRCSSRLRREPVRNQGAAGGRRPAPDAGHQRHLPGLAARRRPRRGRRATTTSASCGTGRAPPSRGMAPATHGAVRRMCGWTLARAHARSGDRVAIAAYLGKQRQVRPGHRRLRRDLRRPERTRPRSLGRCRVQRATGRPDWPLAGTGSPCLLVRAGDT